MGSHRSIALRVVVLLLVVFAACSSGSGEEISSPAPADGAVRVGSFDFAESELLAEIYSQALEGGGYEVRRQFDLGPREFVAPALARGLIDFVPEYAGTAVTFMSVGSAEPGPDVAQTHDALVRTLRGTDLTALAPAPAQDANTFVLTRETAELLGVRTLSDMARVAPELTFGGPPECPTRPLCLAGLQGVYGLQFKEVVPLDAGGPLTRQALRDGVIDMALLFTTDPAIGKEGFVELVDDKRLQPAENVTPLVRTEVIERQGARLVALVDGVSQRLETDELRDLNARVADGTPMSAVAASWLEAEGLR